MTATGDQSFVSRRVAIAALLLVAVAVLLPVVRSWFDRESADVSVDFSLPVSPDLPSGSSKEPVAGTPVDAAPEPIGSGTVVPAEPTRILVLPARIAHPDRETESFVDAVRQAMLRALRSAPNMLIVEISAADFDAVVPPGAGPHRATRPAYLALARRYGGDLVVAISESSPPEDFWLSVQMQVHSAMDSGGGGISVPDSRSPNARPSGNDPESAGRMFARIILGDVEEQSSLASPAGDARQDFLDARRSDAERLQSLIELRLVGFDSETIAAAAELGTRSSSAGTRREVWKVLRQEVHDVGLAQPLTYALLSDPDAAVRKEAALALASYLGEGNTTTALESALRHDASAEVRLAARLSLLDYDEQQAVARSILLDRNLTPAERLAPTLLNRESPMPRLSGSPAEMQDLARGYAEIVAGTDNPDLQLASLSELNAILRSTAATLEPEIVDVLLTSVNVENEHIHRISLDLLKQQAADPEVRAVLEAVLANEPELARELRIPEALE